MSKQKVKLRMSNIPTSYQDNMGYFKEGYIQETYADSDDDEEEKPKGVPVWIKVSWKHVVQCLVVLAIVSVVCVPTAITYLQYLETQKVPQDRIRCLTWDVDQEECESVGCIWAPQMDAPPCFFPPTESHGYTVQNGSWSDESSTLTLELKNSSASLVPGMKELLQLQLIQYSDAVFRIKITVPGEERWEVPLPLNLPEPEVEINSPLYNVSFQEDNGDFTLKVIRGDTQTVLFDSSIGGFTYAEQFLQVSTRLPSSKLYGLGEQFHLSLKHDMHYRTSSLFARDQPPQQEGQNLYGVHPMYLLVEEDGNAHAVFMLNSNAMEAETLPLPGVSLRSIGGIIDLMFFLGPSPHEAVAQYQEVIGKPFLPPYWALGFQLCRYGYTDLDHMKRAVSRTRRHGIPQDVQYADIDHMDHRLDFTIDPVKFENLTNYVKEVKEDGLRFIFILDPAINVERDNYSVHQRAVEKDVYIKWPSNLIPEVNYDAGDAMLGYVWPDDRVAFPDFFKTSTKEWWQEEIKLFYEKTDVKFDGLWIDMNEPANFYTNENKSKSLMCPTNDLDDPPYATYAALHWGNETRISDKTLCMVGLQGDDNNLLHYNVHNLYGWSQSQPTLESLQSVTHSRGIVVSRSTFPGSGQWAGHWLGDNMANWNHLRHSVIGMLEFNIFGIPYVGADICGFFHNTNEELCLRWMQLGAFYPYSRNHNGIGNIDHDPGYWPSVGSASRAALQVRYTLLPYLYTLHYRAHTTGETVVRPLFFEFPTDNESYNIDDQFLWGSSLLIAPVLQKGHIRREVYFPASIWYDYYTGFEYRISSGRRESIAAPLDHIPVFVRGGSILVTQQPAPNTKLARNNPFGLIIAPDGDGSAKGTFFWDDGETIDSVLGKNYLTADITYDASDASEMHISWLISHKPTDPLLIEKLKLSEMRVFGVTTRPLYVTKGTRRLNHADWHYHHYNQSLSLYDLDLNIGSNFNLLLHTDDSHHKIPCPISYQGWNESMGVTEKMCTNINCVWGNENDEVPCTVPSLEVYGYRAKSKKIRTDFGFKVELTRMPATSFYGNDVDNIVFEVYNYNDNTLRFKFYDPNNERFEVPIELNIPTIPVDEQNAMYDIVISEKNEPFQFQIIRKETGTVLFDTSLGGLTFSDQFLSITTLLPSKNIYGLGENSHASFRHNMDAQIWPMFSRDQRPVVGDINYNLYGSHPFYECLENDGNSHGVLLLNSNSIDYQVLSYPALNYRTIGGILDFYMVFGPRPEAVVQQYTQLIGRPVMPPYWGLGFQLSRYGYKDLDDMKDAVKRTKDAGIPQDVQYADIDHMDRRLDFTVDQENFKGLEEYVEKVKNAGLKFIFILDPTINAELDPGSYPPHDEAYQAKAYITWPSDANQSYVDLNNPNSNFMRGYVWPENRTAFPSWFLDSTIRWWEDQIVEFHNKVQFDGIWIDMNEPANFGTDMEQPWNWVEGLEPWSLKCPTSKWDDPPYFPKATSVGDVNRLSDKTLCMAAQEGQNYRHYDVHNLFGWKQTEPTKLAAQAATGKRSLVISRSTFPGSGKHAGHWLGDNQSIWPDMKHSIIGMLEFNLFGIPYIGADICGFFGNASEELCQRWMQLGAFYPFSRNHNGIDNDPQDPGYYGEAVAESSRVALEVRYTLLPFLYTLFYQAHREGSTVVRPLHHEYPEDRRTYNLDDQFLWGDGVMISPVLEEGKVTRDIYFPMGAWYDYYTGTPVKWPGWTSSVSAPTDTIPVHIHGGNILPTQRPGNNTQFSRTQPLGVIVALDLQRKASGLLFWDDGESIDTYENNDYGLFEFSFTSANLSGKLSGHVTHNEDGKLGNQYFWDFVFLGIEQEPKSIMVQNENVNQDQWTYDSLTMKVNLTFNDNKLPLNTDFEIILNEIWWN